MKKNQNINFSLRRLLLATLVAGPLAVLPAPLWALPSTAATNLTSSAGSATITQTVGSTLNISTPDKTVLSWVGFGDPANTINSGESIIYNLPSSSASVLNLVTGNGTAYQTATTIGGNITSNGAVFIVNPNGITVNSSAVINVAGLGLSTIPEAAFNFQATGAPSYSGNATAPVVVSNATITAINNGTVTLAGKGVTVDGRIDAGLLNVISQNATVTLGSSAPLVVGSMGSSGYGNLTVNTNGGNVQIGTNGQPTDVIINGSTANITTGNGSVTEAATGISTVLKNITISANGTVQNNVAPTVTIAGPNYTNGVAATATASLGTTTADSVNGTYVTKINLTNAGSGYTAAPAITVSDTSVTPTVNMFGSAIFRIGTGSSSGTLNINSGTGAVTLTNVSGNGKTLNVALPAAGSTSITQVTDDASLQTSSINGTFTYNAGGGNLGMASGAAVTVATGNLISLVGKNVTFTGPNDELFSVTAGNVTSLTSTAGNITIQSLTSSSNATIKAQNNITESQGATMKVSGKTLTVDAVTGSVALTSLTNNLSGSTLVVKDSSGGATVVNQIGKGNLILGNGTNAAGNVTLTSDSLQLGTTGSDAITVAGNLNLNANTELTSISATGQSGTYSASPVVTIAAPAMAGGVQATATATVSTSGTITGITITNPGTGYALVNGVTAVSVNVTDSTGGNYTTTATIAAGSGSITQSSDNVTVLGNLNVLSSGSVVLAGSQQNGLNLKSQYGQVNAQTANGNLQVFEQTTLNLGNVSIGSGNLIALSTAGNIVQSGAISLTGNSWFGAGTAAAPGDITLTYNPTTGAQNSIGGTVSIIDDNSLLNKSYTVAPPIAGNYLAKNVSITDGAALRLAPIYNVYSTGISGNLTLNYIGGTGNGITFTGNTTNSGVLTITSNDTVTTGLSSGLPNTYITAGSTNVTAPGVVTIGFAGNTTLSANLTSSTAATFTTGAALTLGTITAGAGGVTIVGSGNKSISDSVAGGIQIYGPLSITNNNAISISKGGHNAGAVTLVTNKNNGAITYVEGGTVNIASVSANGSGVVSITSQNGSIIQNASTAGIVTGNSTASFSAAQGDVFLTDAVNNRLSAATSITAGGNATVVQNVGDVKLGNVTVANGFLLVDTSAAAVTGTGNITQVSGAKSYVYGNLALKTNNGAVTLTNSGNRFGGYLISTGSGDIAVTEDTTINAQSIATTGNLTLTSNNGSIIDTTLSNLTVGSTFGSVTKSVTFAANSISGGSTTTAPAGATFTANSGNISLSLAGSVYGVVSLNSGGNASITSNNTTGGSALTLAASNVGGGLSVTNLSTNGNIQQSGAISSFGNTSFLTAGSGGVLLTSNANKFGSVSFVVGSNGATISEASDFVLRAGSVSTGPVVISTGGNFSTTGTGGSSITNTLSVSAVGTITFGAGSLLDTGGVTVFSNNTKDLSALSLAGNLANKAPVNLGTGTYLPPSP